MAVGGVYVRRVVVGVWAVSLKGRIGAAQKAGFRRVDGDGIVSGQGDVVDGDGEAMNHKVAEAEARRVE